MLKNESSPYCTTSYKIDNPTEREILIGYKVLLSASTLIGDSLILVGSLRYNAIKLHKILVIIVQHMAVANILMSLFSIIPSAVSLAVNDQILGHGTCYLTYFFNDGLALVQCLLTGAIGNSHV